MITRVVWAAAWVDGQGVTYDKDSPSRGAAMSDNRKNDALPLEYKQQNQHPLRQVDVGDFINAPAPPQTVIEAAARALYPYSGPPATEARLLEVHAAATAVLTAVTPLIEEAALKRWHHDLAYVRAAALEEAAKVAENHIFYSTNFGPPLKQLEEQIAAAIRALKEQP